MAAKLLFSGRFATVQWTRLWRYRALRCRWQIGASAWRSGKALQKAPARCAHEILLNLFAQQDVIINYHRSARCCFNHQQLCYHSISSNRTLNTLCTAPWRLSLVKIQRTSIGGNAWRARSGGNRFRRTQKWEDKCVDKRFIRFLDRREKEIYKRN